MGQGNGAEIFQACGLDLLLFGDSEDGKASGLSLGWGLIAGGLQPGKGLAYQSSEYVKELSYIDNKCMEYRWDSDSTDSFFMSPESTCVVFFEGLSKGLNLCEPLDPWLCLVLDKVDGIHHEEVNGSFPSWDDDYGVGGQFDDGNAYSDVEDSATLVSQPLHVFFITTQTPVCTSNIRGCKMGGPIALSGSRRGGYEFSAFGVSIPTQQCRKTMCNGAEIFQAGGLDILSFYGSEDRKVGGLSPGWWLIAGGLQPKKGSVYESSEDSRITPT
ncbi:hypothetical protein L1987_56909 [Smallanthus sonchifolius]|uniref:Uncharacterized protein n=1 Tax=Smallanthus sonchifolius TaxID=185202 RepID=A0ACB9DB88_9ASTR|nr:hypothetical protein L1987_56909 [Smallanthus sonchifolius]